MINIAWTILLTAVAMVESGENINAYNQGENAIGLLQIRQPAVDDLNRLWKTSYKLTDFYDPILAQRAFKSYGKMYGAKTAKEYCVIWNGGPRGCEKKTTETYWVKVQQAIKELEK